MEIQQPNLFSFGGAFRNPFSLNGGNGGDLSDGGFESVTVFFFVLFLLFQGGRMDLSKVRRKILSTVRSARSLGLLPFVSSSDRPEVRNVAQVLLNLWIFWLLSFHYHLYYGLFILTSCILISFRNFERSNESVLILWS